MPKSQIPRKSYSPNKGRNSTKPAKRKASAKAENQPTIIQEVKRKAALTATEWLVPIFIIVIVVAGCTLAGVDLNTAITLLSMVGK